MNWFEVGCGPSLLHPHSANQLLDPRIVPGRSGNAHPNICPYDTFATGRTPIFLAVGNDGQFGKLCELIGAPELLPTRASPPTGSTTRTATS